MNTDGSLKTITGTIEATSAGEYSLGLSTTQIQNFYYIQLSITHPYDASVTSFYASSGYSLTPYAYAGAASLITKVFAQVAAAYYFNFYTNITYTTSTGKLSTVANGGDGYCRVIITYTYKYF